MIPHIPSQRLRKANTTKPFNDIVDYVTENKHQELHLFSSKFSNILNYSTNSLDKQTSEEKCIAIRTHGITDISTASIQMNAVSSQNTRCVDPTFHFILSWPEHEHPLPDLIFDAAEHAIKSLGLSEHQYVLAIHGNTDNTHCHIAVNRIHPKTFKSRNIEWARKTLHLAARQSEINHGWSHDNGIYIVETDSDGKKQIILNPKISKSVTDAQPYAHVDFEHEKDLPPWHDPESLETWLKTNVSRALKKSLPKLHDWNALHTWLAKRKITLTDTGGGGMRIHATSPETGEMLDLPASKGLRLLKRADLEARWGKFSPGAAEPNPYIPSFPADRIEIDKADDGKVTKTIVPDLSHLTQQQLNSGIYKLLRISPDHGIPRSLGQLVLHAEPGRSTPPVHRRGNLHELPDSGLDGDGQSNEMLLQHALHLHVGDGEPRQDSDLRSHGTQPESSRRSLNRDDAMREERKNQRAAARIDLRSRFSQYQRFVREGDTDYWVRTKVIQTERSLALKALREITKSAKAGGRKDRSIGLSTGFRTVIKIDIESTRQKLQIEADFQVKKASLKATRIPPLGWRTWLHEQANLGDQAALSALRGIVYQAQRDAKYNSKSEHGFEEEKNEEVTQEYRERKFRQLMARLLDEERKEVAIRSARLNNMRPYEADALLARYIGIQWRVTGNGNIEYSDKDAAHLFTDRGNRITFDRGMVTDEEIRLALVHAQNKFGSELTLTGDDSLFTKRMARLADDMGMTILNPELQITIENHRSTKALPMIEASAKARIILNDPAQQEYAPQASDAMDIQTTSQERQTAEVLLRAKVLSIDPHAKFTIPDISDNKRIFTGPIAVTIIKNENTQSGFAQHIGRGVYALHPIDASDHPDRAILEVQYHDGLAVATALNHEKMKGRNE
jgi:hypothetical protein